jgi:hypothetical protein
MSARFAAVYKKEGEELTAATIKVAAKAAPKKAEAPKK